MMSMNKLLIPSILAATILVAGVFVFMPVEKASTVDQQIIDAINAGNTALALELLEDLGGGHDDLGIGHSDITGELKDKLKLMVETDDEYITIVEPVVGFTIEVEARNAELENVPFNLKEVYLCGYSGNSASDAITIEFVHIENVDFLFGAPFGADIKITDVDGGTLDIDIIDGYTCVDIISALANSGRAGSVGLGSDSNLVIELSGDIGDYVTFLKCIAFTPNEAITLKCDIEPILVED